MTGAKDMLRTMGRAAQIRQMPKASSVLGTPSAASVPGLPGNAPKIVAVASRKLTPKPAGGM